MKCKKMQEKDKINLQLKNMKKVKKLKERGITLIALVTTIIILLILAGVTISQIAGSNGLFQRARQAVEKYKNAAEEEQIQIGMLEQYVTDFSVVGGDEGEDKASVTIKTFTVSGDAKNRQITVKLTVEGQASKIEYSINNGNTWEASDEIEEDKTEYTHTFKELALGKSYYVRIKVYDEEGKYVEAISDIVTLSNEMTATVDDVLETKTFLAKDGSVLTGKMKNNGAINETLSAGGEKIIPAGYTSGGKIIAGTEELNNLKKEKDELEKRVVDLEKENTSLKGATRKRIDLGTERTIDVKTKLQSLGYDSTLYEKLTEENFAVEVSLIWTGGKAYSDNKANRDLWDDLAQEGASPSYSYENGILNISAIDWKWLILADGGYSSIPGKVSEGSMVIETHAYLFV